MRVFVLCQSISHPERHLERESHSLEFQIDVQHGRKNKNKLSLLNYLKVLSLRKPLNFVFLSLKLKKKSHIYLKNFYTNYMLHSGFKF